MPDGQGGAFVTGQDYRAGSTADICAQRVKENGVAQWAANGVPVCTAPAMKLASVLAADGTGGVVVAWLDFRNGDSDVFGQRLAAAGTPLRTANGVALCSAAGDQDNPQVVGDGAGGAFATRTDRRSTISGDDICAQRVSPSGTMLWATNGSIVCSASFNQGAAVPLRDGADGILVAWEDYRGGNSDVYAKRVRGNGATAWQVQGLPVCVLAGTQQFVRAVPDGAGGMIILWADARSGGSDLCAQRVAASGTPLWTANGAAVSTAPSFAAYPALASDGAGGAIAVWEDTRNGAADVYAQRVERFDVLGGPEPAITSGRDLPNDQGGQVKVSWAASYLDAEPGFGVLDYRVWRSVPPQALRAGALARRRGVSADPGEAAAGGRLWVGPLAAQGYAWELVGAQPAGPLPAYSLVVPTTADSVAEGNPLTAFLVQGRSGSGLGAPHWYSLPDSGHSVDNRAPLTPAPFTGAYDGGVTRLAWHPNAENDLAGYRVYRGVDPGFVPGPASRVSAQPDTGCVDPAGTPCVYKLTAVDVHGNESPAATYVPAGTVDAGGASRTATIALAPPAPNPARGSTTLRFALPRASDARLEVFDAAGRRVRVLRSGPAEAGEHAVVFAPDDAAGRALAPGLYVVRLEAGGVALTRRVPAAR